jgi:hypothetical protein
MMRDILPRKRKAQAAMEFLMTYGWAILVVLAAITALAYFGVLSPAKFIPEACTLPSTGGMACIDFTMYQDGAVLYIANGGGRDLVVNNITIDDCTAVFDYSFPDGRQHLFNITGCDFGEAGKKQKFALVLYYTDTMSQFTKSAQGSITAVVS